MSEVNNVQEITVVYLDEGLGEGVFEQVIAEAKALFEKNGTVFEIIKGLGKVGTFVGMDVKVTTVISIVNEKWLDFMDIDEDAKGFIESSSPKSDHLKKIEAIYQNVDSGAGELYVTIGYQGLDSEELDKKTNNAKVSTGAKVAKIEVFGDNFNHTIT